MRRRSFARGRSYRHPVRLCDEELIPLQRYEVVVEDQRVGLAVRDVGIPRPIAIRKATLDADHELISVALSGRRIGSAHEIDAAEDVPRQRCARRHGQRARAVRVVSARVEQRLQARGQRALAVVRHGSLPDCDRGRIAGARGDLAVRVVRLSECCQVVVHVERRATEQRPALSRRREPRFGIDLLQAAVRLLVDAGEAVAVDVVAHDGAGVIDARERERTAVRLEVDLNLVVDRAGLTRIGGAGRDTVGRE